MSNLVWRTAKHTQLFHARYHTSLDEGLRKIILTSSPISTTTCRCYRQNSRYQYPGILQPTTRMLKILNLQCILLIINFQDHGQSTYPLQEEDVVEHQTGPLLRNRVGRRSTRTHS